MRFLFCSCTQVPWYGLVLLLRFCLEVYHTLPPPPPPTFPPLLSLLNPYRFCCHGGALKSRVRWVVEGGVLAGAALENPRGDEGSGSNAEDFLPCSGAFLAIGHKPMTNFLRSPGAAGALKEQGSHVEQGAMIELDGDGFILHKEHTMTSVEGVFACGDVVDRRYRQAISAAGMGCQAAIDCERWLAEEGQ